MSEPLHETGLLLEPVRRAIRSVLARLPWWASEFILFGLKQAWSCLFAGLMLFLMITTKLVWQPDWPIHRYDALFVAALAIQAALLLSGMERWEEARVILVYHVVGTVMEIFKVRMGSWAYPEPSVIQILGVPLFSGFMYAAVGSFMVRAIRIFDMRFTFYPPRWITFLLAAGIYANFYLHHYFYDVENPAFCRNRPDLLARQHPFHHRSHDACHAAGAGSAAVINFPLAGREYRHIDRHLGLSEPEGLAHGVFLQARFMVSAALCQLCAGDAGAQTAPARSGICDGLRSRHKKPAPAIARRRSGFNRYPGVMQAGRCSNEAI